MGTLLLYGIRWIRLRDIPKVLWWEATGQV